MCSFMTKTLTEEKVQQEFNALIVVEASISDETQRRTGALGLALEITSKKVLGKRPKSKHPNWVSSTTLQLIEVQLGVAGPEQTDAESKVRRLDGLIPKGASQCFSEWCKYF